MNRDDPGSNITGERKDILQSLQDRLGRFRPDDGVERCVNLITGKS